MARKKSEIVVIDGIESKECTKCGEVKALSDYYKDTKGLGGRVAKCKTCEKNNKKDYYHKNKEKIAVRMAKYRQENKDNMAKYRQENRDRLAEQNAKYKQENKEKIAVQMAKYRQENKDKIAKRDREYRQENPEVTRTSKQRRLARKRLLPDTLSTFQTAQLLQKGCALTGDHNDMHLDHFIPLSWGHGGTIVENMIPLRGDLNTSKNDSNPFEWIKREDIREIVNMAKWNETIAYLANLNGMSAQEFEEYVYWCEENKRDLTIDEEKTTTA